MAIVRKEPLPKLAAAVARAAAPLNSQLAQAGVRPMTFYAGFMIFEYTESGARFRELLYTILIERGPPWRPGPTISRP